jgi:hypothetical protein
MLRSRGQEGKTPLAVLHEYAARLALKVDLQDLPLQEGGAQGPPAGGCRSG